MIERQPLSLLLSITGLGARDGFASPDPDATTPSGNACPRILGTWELTGTRATRRCVIDPTGCDGSVPFEGAVTAAGEVSFSGPPGSCTGAVRGDRCDGSCTGLGGFVCTYSAIRAGS
ncbi:MAG: hypothetical protein RLP09_05095 [Sandaracinaceae bacterium]